MGGRLSPPARGFKRPPGRRDRLLQAEVLLGTRPRLGAAALGFSSHSGWATLVAVAGPRESPSLVLRRRVVLAVRQPRQPFHAAEGKTFAQAESLVGCAVQEA